MTSIVSTPHGLATESTATRAAARFICRNYFQHVEMIRMARQEGAIGEDAVLLTWFRQRNAQGRFVGKAG